MAAPTGSGKTLAAFLWCLDRLASEPMPVEAERCRVLYVSPLKALAHDVDRNLRSPLVGIRRQMESSGLTPPDITVAIRTGDTPSDARRSMERHPPDILITTPESLFLLLTSAARRILAPVRWLIVDEIHSVAATKRGSHLALSLERLCELTKVEPQRIGLSATQRPLEEVARFLGGTARDVAIVDAGRLKTMEVTVEVPVEDMSRLSSQDDGGVVQNSIWPAIYPRLLELIQQHRSTIVFVNSRRLAERLAARINELAGEELVRAHHGSIAREQRLLIEDMLKAGSLRGLIATSTLELGIDMGAVDLVLQVEAPPSVAAGIQRVGRAGHSVGEVSRGVIVPKFRGDLLETAAVVEGMLEGRIEATVVPRRPLDVLAQQMVAMCAMDEWKVDALAAVVRRAYPYGDLGPRAFESVLDMLSGRYPSDEFVELRPRLVWDRVAGTVRGRAGAQRLAVTNPGTIPDRGLYSVNLVDDGRRVGELDEEMVYESRVGETFVLGASTWRIAEITNSQVLVTPAPGEPGQDRLLESRCAQPPRRARARPWKDGPRAARARAGRRRAPSSRPRRFRRPRHQEPARLPGRPGRRDRRSARRPHRGRRAISRRGRRLARLRAHAVGWPSPRASRPRAGGAATGKAGRPRARALDRRRHRASATRRRGATATRRAAARPRGGERAGDVAASWVGPVRREVP